MVTSKATTTDKRLRCPLPSNLTLAHSTKQPCVIDSPQSGYLPKTMALPPRILSKPHRCFPALESQLLSYHPMSLCARYSLLIPNVHVRNYDDVFIINSSGLVMSASSEAVCSNIVQAHRVAPLSKHDTWCSHAAGYNGG